MWYLLLSFLCPRWTVQIIRHVLTDRRDAGTFLTRCGKGLLSIWFSQPPTPTPLCPKMLLEFHFRSEMLSVPSQEVTPSAELWGSGQSIAPSERYTLSFDKGIFLSVSRYAWYMPASDGNLVSICLHGREAGCCYCSVLAFSLVYPKVIFEI